MSATRNLGEFKRVLAAYIQKNPRCTEARLLHVLANSVRLQTEQMGYDGAAEGTIEKGSEGTYVTCDEMSPLDALVWLCDEFHGQALTFTSTRTIWNDHIAEVVQKNMKGLKGKEKLRMADHLAEYYGQTRRKILRILEASK